jgi:hypothetical protein
MPLFRLCQRCKLVALFPLLPLTHAWQAHDVDNDDGEPHGRRVSLPSRCLRGEVIFGRPQVAVDEVVDLCNE